MEDQVEVFLASLRRCLADEDFLRDFYHRLLSSSEEIRLKFEHTDLERQSRVLADSLYMLAVAAQSPQKTDEFSPAWTEMSRLATMHDRDHLDIRPGLYDLWLHYLLEAANNHDPEFTAEIEECWRGTLEKGIAFLRSHHTPEA